MILIPFPFFLAEIIIFFMAVNWLGLGETLLLYFLPCLLGLFIVSIWGRVALMSIQSSAAKGVAPSREILHAGAIFISGLCFLVPSFFLRILGLCLVLPGLRHLILWRFKAQILKKMSQGNASFSFNGFGFGGGPFQAPPFENNEREVHDANVLDVKPLEISHETPKNEGDA